MNIEQVLTFLEQLQQNNNKAWMDGHKVAYQQAQSTLVAVTDWLGVWSHIIMVWVW